MAAVGDSGPSDLVSNVDEWLREGHTVSVRQTVPKIRNIDRGRRVHSHLRIQWLGQHLETFLYNYCGMLISSGSTSQTYKYDDLNRLVRTEGTSRWGYSTTPSLNVTQYTAWDGRGRPLSGTVLRGGESIDVSIVYDDGARSMTTSYGNGEESYVEQDAYGNTILDGNLTYTAIEMEEICL